MKTRNAIPKDFNTGLIIRNAMRQTGIIQASLARKTGRNASTVRTIKKRRSTQASILHEFSIALGVDLFRPLSDNLPEHIRSNPNQEVVSQLNEENLALKKEIEALKSQLADQRETNKYLKKALDVVSKN